MSLPSGPFTGFGRLPVVVTSADGFSSLNGEAFDDPYQAARSLQRT